jgi:hypothetical protein
MQKNVGFTLWLLILLLTVAGSANAFDGKRTGFVLGFGAGLGTITFSDSDNTNTLSGFQTTLNIGAGITDQILILYSGHTAFYKRKESNFVTGTPTVIARYYFTPTVRSFYVFGGTGFQVVLAWDDYETGGGFVGFGIAAGGGYQFSQHFGVELGAFRTSESGTPFTSIHAAVNVIGF